MSRYTLIFSMTMGMLLFFSIALNVRSAIAVHVNTGLELSERLKGEYVPEALASWEGGRIGRIVLPRLTTVTAIAHDSQPQPPSLLATTREQTTSAVVLSNASQEHLETLPKREKRLPRQEEAPRENFVLEPIHLFLLGSGLILLGMLRNRSRRV